MITTTRRTLTSLACLAVLAASACSSSGNVSKHSSSASAPASASGNADPATTKAVTTAYMTFFATDTSVQQSEGALQHGSAFAKVLAEQAKQSNGATVTIQSVSTVSANVAAVEYTLKTGGITLSGQKGNAVREGGKWKVAAKTFCGLLMLQGSPPSACTDASVTALPH